MSTLAEILAAGAEPSTEPDTEPEVVDLVVVDAEPDDTGATQSDDTRTTAAEETREIKEEPAIPIGERGGVIEAPGPVPEPVPVEEGEVRLGKIRLALQERRREKEELAAEAPSMMEAEGLPPPAAGELLVEPGAPISERPYFEEAQREAHKEKKGWIPHPSAPNVGRYPEIAENQWVAAPGYRFANSVPGDFTVRLFSAPVEAGVPFDWKGFELDPETPLQTIESAEGRLPEEGIAVVDMAPDAWRSRTKVPKFSREPGEGAFVPPEKLQIVHGNVFDIEVWRDMQSRVGGLDQPNWNWFYAQKSTALGVPVPHPGTGIRDLSPNKDPREDYLTLLNSNDINARVEADHPSLSEEFKGWYRWIRQTPTWEMVGKRDNAVAVAIGTREAPAVQRFLKATVQYEAFQERKRREFNTRWQEAGGKFYTVDDYTGPVVIDPNRTQEDPNSGITYILDKYHFRIPNYSKSKIDSNMVGQLRQTAGEINSSNDQYLLLRAELVKELRPSAEENIPSNLEMDLLIGEIEDKEGKAAELTTGDLQRVLSAGVISLDDLRLFKEAADELRSTGDYDTLKDFDVKVAENAENEKGLSARQARIAGDLFSQELLFLESVRPKGETSVGRLAEKLSKNNARIAEIAEEVKELEKIVASGEPREAVAAATTIEDRKKESLDLSEKNKEFLIQKLPGGYDQSYLAPFFATGAGFGEPLVAPFRGLGSETLPGLAQDAPRLERGLRGMKRFRLTTDGTEAARTGVEQAPGSTITGRDLTKESLEQLAFRRLIMKAREAQFLQEDRTLDEKLAFVDVEIAEVSKLLLQAPGGDLSGEAAYKYFLLEREFDDLIKQREALSKQRKLRKSGQQRQKIRTALRDVTPSKKRSEDD